MERVQRIGRDLAQATAAPDRVDFGLSSRDAIGAWSWPDGRIRVSRALVDLLDDDALRAAVAHEIGHLLDGGHVASGAAALAGGADHGRHDAVGSELRADAVACTLLRSRTAPVDALPRMLRTVASRVAPDDDGPDPATLRARASAAERTCSAAH
jgi:Zn-dependent protease with chaperone function